MQFALLVKSHANTRYEQSLQKLATLECECLLFALKVQAHVALDQLAGSPFIIVETDSLDETAWAYLSRHSGIAFAAVKEGECLRPIALRSPGYLQADLPQILKYKGKTNADFTAMMLNCARSASAFALSQEPLRVLDPLCGRGTTLFCALQEGDCAIGIDRDEKALREADTYLTRYLQYHRYKHKRVEKSITMRSGGAAREIGFTLANEAQSYKAGNTISLQLIHGDTSRADELTGAQGCHLIVGDLPYGVQHAPREGRAMASMEGLL
ncbi:MAG: hypothetical protein PHO41_11245, partial [Eubacteriales bacterium]|nr:hypothetical protein [Eubacteriales bacterium]